MARTARAVSLAWTLGAGDSTPTSPIGSIQDHNVSDEGEVAEFLQGTARVNSHFASKVAASIEITTSQVDKVAQFRVGQRLTNVILTVEAIIDSAGTKIGTDQVHTLSSAIVVEKGSLQHGNEDSTPATRTVKFQLSRAADAEADPTYTVGNAT